MVETGYLTNQFLIAMPNLLDPNFFHSVTYICEHNENGAMGIVVNQPVDLTVGELIEQMDEKMSDTQSENNTVFRGGPVEVERGFVIHNPVGLWESTMTVSDNIGVTTSNDIITAIAESTPDNQTNDKAPKDYLIALGYAGWGAGQLEAEIRDNAWLNCEANAGILFKTDVEKRWEAAAALIGIDINQLTGEAGHA